MSLKLGSRYTPDRHIPPDNQGMSWIAQKRLENIVGRAVERHRNALLVDANPIYVWVRQPDGQGGIPCTCQSRAADTSMGGGLINPEALAINATKPINGTPPKESPPIDDDDDEVFGNFEVIHIRGDNNTNPNTLSNTKQKEFGINQNTGNLEEQTGDQFNETEAPEAKQSNGYDPNKIARYLDSPYGGGIYGADATVCSICYSTGRVNGYKLANGDRIILDASGLNPYTLYNAKVNPNKRPNAFTLYPEGYVEWTVDIPYTVTKWMNFGVMNNDRPASGLIIEILWNNVWEKLTPKWLKSHDKVKKERVKLRVRVDPKLPFSSSVVFTHADIRYMLGEPILAQCPQLDMQIDYEYQDALVSTNFEVEASLDYFPRESYFQDSKYGYVWKANSVTANTTSLNQVYVYEVNARRVLPQEIFSTMAVRKPPKTDNLGHKGFTFIQGDIQRENFPHTDKKMEKYIPNKYQLNQTQGDEYLDKEISDIPLADDGLW